MKFQQILSNNLKNWLTTLPLILAFCLTISSCSSENQEETTLTNTETVIENNNTNTPKEPKSESSVEQEVTSEEVNTENPQENSQDTPTEASILEKTEDVVVETSKEDTDVKTINSGKEETSMNEESEIISETEEITEEEIVEEVAEVIEEKTFNHDKFNALLKENVTSTGNVNYQGFKNSPSFQEYLDELSANEPDTDWTTAKKLAYWINVYNAFTIKLICDNYPVNSITDISNGKPWDKKFINIGDKTYTLNEVEHTIIRGRFNEPRIHFACVCAAKSCPRLLNEAYTEDKIWGQLTRQAKYFINKSGKNSVEPGELKLSQLFSWYADDFGDVNEYIKKYYSEDDFEADEEIEFLEYNWTLNE